MNTLTIIRDTIFNVEYIFGKNIGGLEKKSIVKNKLKVLLVNEIKLNGFLEMFLEDYLDSIINLIVEVAKSPKYTKLFKKKFSCMPNFFKNK